jgi:bacterioferritin-associated ferredoxin
MAEKPVRACICFPHSFVELLDLARANGWSTAEDISKAVGCGTGCGQCRPYLRLMLETGETEFEILPNGSRGAGRKPFRPPRDREH